ESTDSEDSGEGKSGTDEKNSDSRSNSNDGSDGTNDESESQSNGNNSNSNENGDRDNGSTKEGNNGESTGNEENKEEVTKNESAGNDQGNGEHTIEDIKQYHRWYQFGVTAAPGGLTWGLGYKVKKNNNYYIVNGPRDIKGRWTKSWAGKQLDRVGASELNHKVGKGLDKVYHNERGINRYGTRYGIGTKKSFNIHKYANVKAGLKAGFKQNYGKGALKFSNNLRGGGLIGHAMIFSADIYNYSPLSDSKKSDIGYASTDFASEVIVDGGIAAGTTAASSIVGTMVAGSSAGSVIPGAGTVAGAVVGLGIELALTTKTGRRATNWAKDKVKAGLDKVGSTIKDGWNKVTGLFS